MEQPTVMWLQKPDPGLGGWWMWVSEPCLPPGPDGVRPPIPRLEFVACAGRRVRLQRRTRETGPYVKAWVTLKPSDQSSVISQLSVIESPITEEQSPFEEEASPFDPDN